MHNVRRTPPPENEGFGQFLGPVARFLWFWMAWDSGACPRRISAAIGYQKKKLPPWRRPRRLTPDSVHSVLKGTQSKGTQHTVWENTLSIPWRSSSSLPARKAPHGGNAFLPCDISTSG